MQVNIRPLEEADALISYKWRNNPEIWQYTGNKPDKIITYDIELQWIRAVLQNKNEKRFAIVVDGEYIGNTYLTDIDSDNAYFHIFIGEIDCWGKGIGSTVLEKVIKYAKDILKLKTLKLFYNKQNITAGKLYTRFGFCVVKTTGNEVLMEKQL